jgi:hypothetical protein
MSSPISMLRQLADLAAELGDVALERLDRWFLLRSIDSLVRPDQSASLSRNLDRDPRTDERAPAPTFAQALSIRARDEPDP